MVPGLVGMVLGIEVIKYVVSGSCGLFGNMLLYDGILTTFRKTKLRSKKENCQGCGKEKLDISTYDYLKYDPPCGSAPPEVRNISWK